MRIVNDVRRGDWWKMAFALARGFALVAGAALAVGHEHPYLRLLGVSLILFGSGFNR